MNNPVLIRRHSLRQLTATSLCLLLLGQVVVFSNPAFAQAQSRKVRVRKSSKKKKRHPSGTFASPLVLPSLSVNPNNTADNPVVQSSDSKKYVKTSVLTQTVPKSGTQTIQATTIRAASITKVSLRTLTTRSKARPSITGFPINSNQLLPAPGSIQEVSSPFVDAQLSAQLSAGISTPLIPSPVAVQNFQGESDEAKGGGPTGTFTTPPDTMGAVGINKVVSYVNNNIVVQDKITGAQLSLASLDSFWAGSGSSNPLILAFNTIHITIVGSSRQFQMRKLLPHRSWLVFPIPQIRRAHLLFSALLLAARRALKAATFRVNGQIFRCSDSTKTG